jgi:hypothetical protein
MRRVIQIAALASAIFVAFFFAPAPGAAKPEYSRRTQKECTFCHPRDSWNLTEAGKYFRDHHYSLQGYTPPKSDGKQQSK